MEDDRSSLGGHCVSVEMHERELQTTCTKCDNGGCNGLSQDFIENNIGDGSCCGSGACFGVDQGEIISLNLQFLCIQHILC